MKIYKDKRITNSMNPPNFYGKRKEMFIAEENGKQGFGYSKEQAVKNLKRLNKGRIIN